MNLTVDRFRRAHHIAAVNRRLDPTSRSVYRRKAISRISALRVFAEKHRKTLWQKRRNASRWLNPRHNLPRHPQRKNPPQRIVRPWPSGNHKMPCRVRAFIGPNLDSIAPRIPRQHPFLEMESSPGPRCERKLGANALFRKKITRVCLMDRNVVMERHHDREALANGAPFQNLERNRVHL